MTATSLLFLISLALPQVAPPTTNDGDCTPATAAGTRGAISYRALSPAGVRGALGLPLGSVVTLTGTVLSDDVRRMRADLGKTLLRVEKVSGKPLPNPVIVELRCASQARYLAGKAFEIVGYESGAFSGLPAEVFKYIPQRATTGFGFVVWVNLVKELSLK